MPKVKKAKPKAKAKVRARAPQPKPTKVVDSTSKYISFGEVALNAEKKGAEVEGYKLSKTNRRGEKIGNSIVVDKYISAANAAGKEIPWGEIQGYGGVARRIKCIRKTDLARVVRGLMNWAGKGTEKPRKKNYRVFSKFEDF